MGPCLISHSSAFWGVVELCRWEVDIDFVLDIALLLRAIFDRCLGFLNVGIALESTWCATLPLFTSEVCL